MTATIPVYGLDWHLGQSPAQNDLLIEPLQPYVQFEQHSWDGWKLDLPEEKIRKSPIIFFFFSPPPNILANPHARLVWIPMWDDVRRRSQGWWQKLPKNLRIVAFSGEVRKRAESAGLQTLSIKYFKDPAKFEPAHYDGKRILFYWNRTGLVEPGFVQDFCDALDINILLFRRNIDPRIPVHLEYSLPKKLGNTIVQEVPGIEALTRDEYLDIFNQVNIMIAPRSSEGVGITYIEALARGCAVFAFNGPTMNEYIYHKRNGYLFNSHSYTPGNLIRYHHSSLNRWIAEKKSTVTEADYPRYPITRYQNWKEITGLNLEILGSTARQEQGKGYQFWKNIIPRYAEFILNW
jgi:glycosyltransferase involved in cell wall biosynthesis